MTFVAIAALLNIGLDPLVISVLDWGIRGAAVATVVSQGIAFIGANRLGRVRDIAVYGTLYNFAIMLVIAIIVFLLAEPAIRLFIQEEEDAVRFGTNYLMV